MSSTAQKIFQRSGPGAPEARPEPDLSTRQVAQAPAPKVEFDTDTPAARPIEPFTLADFPEWGDWLIGRMRERWSHIDPFSARSRLAQMISDNEVILIRTNRAIAAATMMQSPLEVRPYVQGIFAFMRTDNAASDIVALYRSIEHWGRFKGAKEFRPGLVTDLSPSKLKESFEERVLFVRKFEK